MLNVPVLVWALTTTPPVTVFVVVPDDVVPLSGSDELGVVDGSVEVCVLVVVVVPVVVAVFVLVSVVPLVLTPFLSARETWFLQVPRSRSGGRA